MRVPCCETKIKPGVAADNSDVGYAHLQRTVRVKKSKSLWTGTGLEKLQRYVFRNLRLPSVSECGPVRQADYLFRISAFLIEVFVLLLSTS